MINNSPGIEGKLLLVKVKWQMECDLLEVSFLKVEEVDLHEAAILLNL